MVLFDLEEQLYSAAKERLLEAWRFDVSPVRTIPESEIMDQEADPVFSKGVERQKGIEATYGNLGRHVVTATGVEVSEAEQFNNAIERLGIVSLPDVALVPRNLETAPDIDHLVYERESKDLQALASQLGFAIAPLSGAEVATIHENDISVILPGLVIGLHAIEALNGFATIAEFFTNISKHFGARRTTDGAEVELSQEVIIKNGSKTKRLTYKGPASSLPTIVDLMKSEFEKNDET